MTSQNHCSTNQDNKIRNKRCFDVPPPVSFAGLMLARRKTLLNYNKPRLFNPINC